MIRALKFRRRLWGVAVFVIAILGFAFLLAQRSAGQTEAIFEWSAHSEQALDTINQARFNRSQLMVQLWTFQATHSPDARARFRDKLTMLRGNMNDLRALVADNPEQIDILNKIRPLLAAQLTTLENGMSASSDDPTTVASSWRVSPPFQPADPIADLFDKLELDDRLLLSQRSAAVRSNVERARRVLLAAGLLTVAILLAATHLIQREIVFRATVEVGLRRAQEMLGVKFAGQRAELGHVLEDLHAQILARTQAEVEVRRLNTNLGHQVKKRTAELEEMNRELEAFTYSVSHDLRAPLRHLDGFSRILLENYESELPEGARHYLNRIHSAAKLMSELVEDLLQFSRVGRQATRRELMSLRVLVDEAHREVEPECTDRNVRWEIGPLPAAEVDPGLFRLVFINLFANAVKFTRHRQVATIEVGSFIDNGMNVVFVRDNGAGFDPRHADKLFGVFQRLHRQDEFEGTGIGLATIQRVVQKHDGRVWAESEVDKGACFFFSLPTAPVTTPETKQPIGVLA